jgi:hypothetical protein
VSIAAAVVLMMARVTDPDILRQLNAPPPCKDGKTECKRWERDWPRATPDKFGPGPHTLVISDGRAITRMDYKTGSQCLKARTDIERQLAPEGGGLPQVRIRAFCVPR